SRKLRPTRRSLHREQAALSRSEFALRRELPAGNAAREIENERQPIRRIVNVQPRRDAWMLHTVHGFFERYQAFAIERRCGVFGEHFEQDLALPLQSGSRDTPRRPARWRLARQ